MARKVSSNKINARKILFHLVKDFSEILAERQAFSHSNISNSSSSDSSSSSEDKEDHGNGSDHAFVHFLEEDDIIPENTGPAIDPEYF